jgi:hypothetical protein
VVQERVGGDAWSGGVHPELTSGGGGAWLEVVEGEGAWWADLLG